MLNRHGLALKYDTLAVSRGSFTSKMAKILRFREKPSKCGRDGAGEWGGAGGYKDFAPDGAANRRIEMKAEFSNTSFLCYLFYF